MTSSFYSGSFSPYRNTPLGKYNQIIGFKVNFYNSSLHRMGCRTDSKNLISFRLVNFWFLRIALWILILNKHYVKHLLAGEIKSAKCGTWMQRSLVSIRNFTILFPSSLLATMLTLCGVSFNF